ncbi:histidine phosphatase family protein [Roseateles violae]|uniref:Histidine phosphatase family protein n=1 Tax=Roseateles violae TaxID=3058042 RepID=A0ABT8DL96_9BURK|nr:histidine phosphatase family protein [Pelomonas sp. PFR6]MDN3918678.1 histidine phosphatase family protein [Pelomonas sp. PFR6]
MDASTRILAVRHGETQWNRETRIQGQLDIPLNETGLEQARRVGAALREEAIDLIYSSDLARARQTAEAVARATGVELRLDAELRERSFGRFEGLSWAEIAERWPALSERWRRRDLDFDAEGGETLPIFYQRCVGAVERLAARHPGRTLLIVAHGGVMDCLYRAATRLPLQAPRSWELGNAAINRLLYSPQGLSLVGWNDQFHLDDRSLDELAEKT